MSQLTEDNTLLFPTTHKTSAGRRDASPIQDHSLSWREILDMPKTTLQKYCADYRLPGLRPKYELIYFLALNEKLSDVDYSWLSQYLSVVKVMDSGVKFSSDSIQMTKYSGLLDLLSKFSLQSTHNIGSLRSDPFEVTFYPHWETLNAVVSGSRNIVRENKSHVRRKIAEKLRSRGHGHHLSIPLLEDTYQLVNEAYFSGMLEDWVLACWHTVSFSIGAGERIHGMFKDVDRDFSIRISEDSMIHLEDPDPLISMLLTFEHEVSHMIVHVWTYITDNHAGTHGPEFKRVMQHWFGLSGKESTTSTYVVKNGVVQSQIPSRSALDYGQIKDQIKVHDRVKIGWDLKNREKNPRMTRNDTGVVVRKGPKRATVKIDGYTESEPGIPYHLLTVIS